MITRLVHVLVNVFWIERLLKVVSPQSRVSRPAEDGIGMPVIILIILSRITVRRTICIFQVGVGNHQ